MRRAATVSAVKRDETLANTAPELSGGDHGGFDVIHATWQMLSEVLLRSEQPGSECVPSTGALVSADLEKLRELVGVFDAFEEVNYTLRKDVSPLYGRAMVQLSELYSYFSGDTLYVPGDAEDGGLEEAQPLAKQASQLDPSIQLMRRNLCEAIESLLSSYLSLAPCCMACLMDPSGKGAALPSKAAEMAWRTLQKEVLEADGHQCRAEQPSSNPSSASAAFSTGCSVADTEAGAGDLANSLREHREQSTLQEFLEYKRMPPLTNFRSGALEWWAHRVGRGSASSLSSFEAPTALGAVAAKYCSMDAVHCPVESLFEGMSQRVLELLVNLKQSDVVAMLFLRMNSALLLPSNEP